MLLQGLFSESEFVVAVSLSSEPSEKWYLAPHRSTTPEVFYFVFLRLQIVSVEVPRFSSISVERLSDSLNLLVLPHTAPKNKESSWQYLMKLDQALSGLNLQFMPTLNCCRRFFGSSLKLLYQRIISTRLCNGDIPTWSTERSDH
jgi:hypothetical protein